MKDPEDLGSWFEALAAWDARRLDAPAASEETVRYGDHPDQHYEVWVASPARPASPAGPASPTVISLHGGYFLPEYDKSLHTAMSRQLAIDGYTVANVEYRRGSEGRDATIADVLAAIDSIVDELHPSRVAVFGHSAGGYLAEVLARHPAVELVIPLAPVSDLEQAAREGWDDGGIALWLGGGPDEKPESYREAGLCSNIRGAARRVVIHGTADTAVGVEQSRAFTRVLADAGVDVTYLELPGEGHYGYLDPREDAFGVLCAQLDSWRSAP